MMKANISSVVFLAAIIGCAGFSYCNAQTPNTPRPAYSEFNQIYVDESCHLLPAQKDASGDKTHQRLRQDPVICHLETILNSEHVEEKLLGNELRRNRVQVNEQTYLLQNITQMPVVFVVEHFVPDGWVVDSDPQPVRMDQSTAIFQAHAQPGEIVQLHVGIRKTTPLKTKILKKSPLS